MFIFLKKLISPLFSINSLILNFILRYSHLLFSKALIVRFKFNLILFFATLTPTNYNYNHFIIFFRKTWFFRDYFSLPHSNFYRNINKNINWNLNLIGNTENKFINRNLLLLDLKNFNKIYSNSYLLMNLFYTEYSSKTMLLVHKTFSFGYLYIQGFCFILFIDACLTDDEPLWEPIEWSLVQTWILFIFLFAWIAENLIVSRYGSYTGRDKRVWMAWYKTFWLIEGFYVFNHGIAILFVMIPFYYETNYNLSFVYSWWHWYSRVFFFKFVSIFSLIILISHFLQINVRWMHWKQGLYIVILVNILLAYLLFTHFIMIFFGYFTDPVWYQRTRPIDYVQLSQEPAKWGWGSAKKDHFTYHSVKTVLWFKNDGPLATSFLFFQICFWFCIFFLYLYWVVLFRRIYSTSEIPITLTTYCVSGLKQFFFYSGFLYFFVFLSYLVNYWRFPFEFLWTIDSPSWFINFFYILIEYPFFIVNIFFL